MYIQTHVNQRETKLLLNMTKKNRAFFKNTQVAEIIFKNKVQPHLQPFLQRQ